MGKKRVIKQTKEALLQERERVEERMARDLLKAKKKVDKARVYIKSTYNNTIITVTEDNGNVLFWSSAGHVGFKGTKKGTPFAATKVAEVISGVLEKAGTKEVEVYIKGIGQGRDAALKTLANRNIPITFIKDVTPIPHNGPRPPKPRHP